KKDQDFKTYATAWEIRHSKLPFGSGSGKADPLVDDNMTVIGHVGWYDTDSIYVPAKAAAVTTKKTIMVRGQGKPIGNILWSWDPLKESQESIRDRTLKPVQVEVARGLPQLLNDGVEVHCDDFDKSYLKQGYATPLQQQRNYRIVTCPEGRAQYL